MNRNKAATMVCRMTSEALTKEVVIIAYLGAVVVSHKRPTSGLFRNYRSIERRCWCMREGVGNSSRKAYLNGSRKGCQP